MRYSIFFLLSGELKEYQQKLVKEVGPKFGENYLVENKLPAHATIKTPFESNNIEDLEKLIEEFVKGRKAVKFKVEKFDNFRKFVAFLKPDFSDEIMDMQKELIEKIKYLGTIELKDHDLRWEPHFTIAYGNTEETFNSIWDYLMKLDKPNFESSFDNISIMKKVNGFWEVHRKFDLG